MKHLRTLILPVVIAALVFAPLAQLAQSASADALKFNAGVSAQLSNMVRGLAQSTPDPVIAAAGDIACDPINSVFNNGNGNSNACRQKYTSDLLVNANLAAVLDLGDNQYFCGSLQAFQQSYDPSWGRVKDITHPVLGNHEYLTSGDPSGNPSTGCTGDNINAAGYWAYFGSAAGTPPSASSPGVGYYSFDIGDWHIIAIDSDCTHAGGCGSGSPEWTWLKNDLMAHTANYCTLAYWHVPLYSSGGRATTATKAFYQLLYDYDADLVLTGHDHIYERFAPQDPNGALDLTRGIREFVVGTGGADHTGLPVGGTIAPNSEVHNFDTFGVFKLTLHSTSAEWQFVPEAGKTFSDAGTLNCHQTDRTPPSAPTALTASANGSQADLSWTASQDNQGVTGYAIYRNGSQIGASSGTTFSDSSLQANMGYSYNVAALDAAGNVSAQSAAATLATPLSSFVFNDGFESGNLAQWTSVSGLTVQQQEVLTGVYAARSTSAAGAASYARKLLPVTQNNLYYRIRFKVISQAANTVNLLKFRTATDTPILSVGMTGTGLLNYRNEVTATSVNSPIVIGKGAWQTLQVHVRMAGAASQVETWYNDAPVAALTRSESLGSNPIGRLQLGENTSSLTYDIAYDDVSAAIGYIVYSSSAPVITSTPTPTVTATVTATVTPTSTPTLTATLPSVPTFTPTPTSTVSPTATTAQTSTVFSDGFESGNLAQWTSVSGLTVQQQEVLSGVYAARSTSAAGAASYARKLLPVTQNDLFYRIRFKVISQAANTVNLIKFRTATDTPILSVTITSTGLLNYRNEVTATSVNSSVVIGKGAWQTLQVHVRMAGTASQVEVWYNDALVLTRTESLGSNPIGRLQLGENTSGLTYDIAYDDLVAALSYVASSPVVTITPTPTGTVTSTSTAVITFTPTPTSTALPVITDTPTPTVTATVTSTVTSTQTSTATLVSVPTFTPTPTSTASPTPTATSTNAATSLLFSDGFESGDLSQWTSVSSLTVQQQQVLNGGFAARAASSAGPATYARKLLPVSQSDIYYFIHFKVVSKGNNNTSLLKFRSASDASILSLGINSLGQLSYRNDVAGASVTSTTVVANGVWQTLQVHVRIAGTASLIEVWYNGAPVSILTRTESFGSNPVGRLQLGENTPGLTYDIAFDDVNAALNYIDLP
jgi:hypothetical protein